MARKYAPACAHTLLISHGSKRVAWRGGVARRTQAQERRRGFDVLEPRMHRYRHLVLREAEQHAAHPRLVVLVVDLAREVAARDGRHAVQAQHAIHVKGSDLSPALVLPIKTHGIGVASATVGDAASMG